MTKFKEVKIAYFVGIGGAGMSALAQYFLHLGFSVMGYDRVETEITKKLSKLGIGVTYKESINHLKKLQEYPKNQVLVVYTPAINKENNILTFFRNKGYLLKKRAEVLGICTKGKYTIAVAGTHGKTTTSSIIAHILTHSGKGCSAIIGGIMENYDNNLLLSKTSSYFVVEADEYDRSFHHLHPTISVVTSTDLDHPDIYSSQEELQESVNTFLGNMQKEGTVYLHTGVKNIKTSRKKVVYGENSSEVCIKNFSVENGTQVFDLCMKDTIIKEVFFSLPGKHNVTNALVASAVCWQLGVSEKKIKEALKAFKPPKRRFNMYPLEKGKVYIDDYAHHPQEIEATWEAIKEFFPNKKVAVLFQPHTFSRTKTLSEEFAISLSKFDVVFLLPIYPAREIPIRGVSSESILSSVSTPVKKIISKEEAVEFFAHSGADIYVTLGAGDISTLVPVLREIKG